MVSLPLRQEIGEVQFSQEGVDTDQIKFLKSPISQDMPYPRDIRLGISLEALLGC